MSEALGRKDWDYVSMADYRADMRESSETAVAVIDHLRRNETDVRRRLAITELALADALKKLGGRTVHKYVAHIA